ncbi:MAG: hypothetical protein SOZ86_06845 [Bacteroidaceae bacterium]|nr:hypothetical protein [Bacteroidaceae bacterium]
MLNSEYLLTARCWRWLCRWRHRRGYGVHSPYAFHFITDVVYESSAYYAYAPLHRCLTAANWYAMRYDTLCGLSEKDIRLLFRLVNFCQPSCFLFHGASEVLVDMFRAAAPHAEFLAYLPSEVPTRVFIYEDKAHRCLSSLPSIFPFGSMMVVRGIHRNAAAETAWKTLKQRAEVTLTFDLGRFGIALSVEKMAKQDYIVCYF